MVVIRSMDKVTRLIILKRAYYYLENTIINNKDSDLSYIKRTFIRALYDAAIIYDIRITARPVYADMFYSFAISVNASCKPYIKAMIRYCWSSIVDPISFHSEHNRFGEINNTLKYEHSNISYGVIDYEYYELPHIYGVYGDRGQYIVVETENLIKLLFTGSFIDNFKDHKIKNFALLLTHNAITRDVTYCIFALNCIACNMSDMLNLDVVNIIKFVIVNMI